VPLFVVVIIDFGQKFQTDCLSCAHAVVDPLQLTDVHLHLKSNLALLIALLLQRFLVWTLDWGQELETIFGRVRTIVDILSGRLPDQQIVR
jgi:hypothetical protein